MIKLLAKLLLSKEAIQLGEELNKNGVKIISTKVPSLTGYHYVFEAIKNDTQK